MNDLTWPRLAVGLAVAVVLLLLWWTRRPRRVPAGLLVAHTDRLRSLPRFRKLARRELLVAGVAATGALLLVVGTIWMGARPVRQVLADPDRNGRDIMLCLDVSPSMGPWNRQVLDSFQTLLAELNGERLGLTIFSGAGVTVLPLTDDYGYVAGELRDAARAFANQDASYFAGVDTGTGQTNQAGDGLMSCLQRFDKVSKGRGRAVVLATANDPVGAGIFTLPEAAREAVRDRVVVYGIGTPGMDRTALAQLAAAAADTGGRSSVVEDEVAVGDLVRAIQRNEVERLRPRPAGIDEDDPTAPLGVATAGLVLLLGGAVVGRRR
ncbi:VWA domain-containing protein [Nocardioides dongkuii]|uniref:VWA domain-containing protein n=1 Tax=Nocardioides dongkuii TaxID=2760089 RepID=UPI0015F89776|nr:VWA domain-containing protein [Nocardioides dongkuii]